MKEPAPFDIGEGYVIERKLGTGSYATVWLARKTSGESGGTSVVRALATRASCRVE